jgi:hypothetical protein
MCGSIASLPLVDDGQADLVEPFEVAQKVHHARAEQVVGLQVHEHLREVASLRALVELSDRVARTSGSRVRRKSSSRRTSGAGRSGGALTRSRTSEVLHCTGPNSEGLYNVGQTTRVAGAWNGEGKQGESSRLCATSQAALATVA